MDPTGDSNSAYFHALMRKRYALSRISTVLDASGNLITDMDLVQLHFVQYYQNIMGTTTNTKGSIQHEVITMGVVLSLSQQIYLQKAFDRDDVKRALFKIYSRKNRGSDGYGSDFF